MKEQGVGETLIGLISSTSIALWFFFGLLWGRLADQTGGRGDGGCRGCCLDSIAGEPELLGASIIHA